MAGKSDPKEIELVPDAWPRFERFIKQVAKSPPQHRVKSKAKSKNAASPKVRQRKAKK